MIFIQLMKIKLKEYLYMFHVVLLFFLSLSTVSGLPFRFDGTETSIEVSSSKFKNQLQMVIAVNGSVGEQIKLSTQALSAEHGTHTLKLADDRAIVYPQMHDEIIVFNYKYEGQYFVALSHDLKSEADNFLPLEISLNDKKKQLLLAAVDLRMTQIDKNSLYRCHNLLIEVQVDNQRQITDLTFFTVDKKESIWQVDGKLEHQWRHTCQKIIFGGATKKNTKENIKIFLKNNKYCEFNVQDLPKPSKKTLNNKKYHSIDHLLEWASAFKVQEQVKVTNEQL